MSAHARTVDLQGCGTTTAACLHGASARNVRADGGVSHGSTEVTDFITKIPSEGAEPYGDPTINEAGVRQALALRQQFEIDRTIWMGETQKADVGAPVVYSN
jgi:hypothetical protein